MSRSLTSAGGRRVRVLLASGLILGVGAAGTLAAWTDTVGATGAFSASTFGIELNVDGGWNIVREMTFGSTGMYPGAVKYAQVLVRTTSGTDLDADVRLSGQGDTGTMANELTYKVVNQTVQSGQSAPVCSATLFDASATYVLGSFSTGVTMSNPDASTTSQLISAFGTDYSAYCFEVTLPSSAPSNVQGAHGQHTWNWEATSRSPEVDP